MSARSPRVLVVDDEADLRELLELTLLKMGLDVDSAATLAEARALLAGMEYQLVLTDMRLPDGLGLELVREIAATCKNTPVAVVTAFGSADNAVVALKAGAFDYISKPVALDQLRLSLNPDRPLDLGFARVNFKDGALITSPDGVAAGDALELTFKGDRKLEAIAGAGGTPPAPKPAPVKKASGTPPQQGSLF